ncbi:unnamed protein product [Prunus brigantina]
MRIQLPLLGRNFRGFSPTNSIHLITRMPRSQFLYLKQGSMSVVEYEHKFNELSRFAPELVATEEDRRRRFEGGLWWEIQVVVTANTYPNMKALAQAAERVSRRCDIGASRRHRDAPGLGGPSQGPSKRGGSSSSSASGGWSGGRGSSSGSGRSAVGRWDTLRRIALVSLKEVNKARAATQHVTFVGRWGILRGAAQ